MLLVMCLIELYWWEFGPIWIQIIIHSYILLRHSLAIQDYRNTQNLKLITVGETRTSTDVILSGFSKDVGARRTNLDTTVRTYIFTDHTCTIQYLCFFLSSFFLPSPAFLSSMASCVPLLLALPLYCLSDVLVPIIFHTSFSSSIFQSFYLALLPPIISVP